MAESVKSRFMTALPSRGVSTRDIPDSEWEAIRDTFTLLYRSGQGLKSIQEILKREHGFIANERQYKGKVKKWKLQKNLKSDEKAFMVYKQAERLQRGKQTIFKVNGYPVDATKIEQAKKKLASESKTLNQIVTPINITYGTPVARDRSGATISKTSEEFTHDSSNSNAPRTCYFVKCELCTVEFSISLIRPSIDLKRFLSHLQASHQGYKLLVQPWSVLHILDIWQPACCKIPKICDAEWSDDSCSFIRLPPAPWSETANKCIYGCVNQDPNFICVIGRFSLEPEKDINQASQDTKNTAELNQIGLTESFTTTLETLPEDAPPVELPEHQDILEPIHEDATGLEVSTAIGTDVTYSYNPDSDSACYINGWTSEMYEFEDFKAFDFGFDHNPADNSTNDIDWAAWGFNDP